jgi:streptomycin 6-kinase
MEDLSPLLNRVEEWIHAWGITVDQTQETESAFLAFGTRNGQPVVLKVFRRPGDEWDAGSVLEAFAGPGTVRVHEHVKGAVLMERLHPGIGLTSLVLEGRDDEATRIVAGIIRQTSNPPKTLAGAATVADWGKGFERYLASGDDQIPLDLVKEGRNLYSHLCSSQQDVRLLHGDLHHGNILLDANRGWTAIDPKGVIGEVEYELGASLRNPQERQELLASAVVIKERLAIYRDTLELNMDRALRWSFAEAVLSAIWSVEDGFTVSPDNPSLILARAVRPLIG